MTSHLDGEPYPDLLSQKGGRGFPYLAFLDEHGDLLATHSGERTVENFRATLAQAREFHALLARSDLTIEERYQVFLRECALGRIAPQDVQTELAAVATGLTDEQSAIARQAVADLEVKQVLGTLTARSTPEDRIELGARLWGMHGEGKIPSDARQRQAVWGMILPYAEARGDVAAMETALADMRILLEGNPRAAPYFAEWEAKLDALRGTPPAVGPNAAPPGG
ncbi:MAG: hypothetical protein HY608_11195 [Planctomycetes bacterium]|nr:hypothetical protein [Planctomycetota bacterium]